LVANTEADTTISMKSRIIKDTFRMTDLNQPSGASIYSPTVLRGCQPDVAAEKQDKRYTSVNPVSVFAFSSIARVTAHRSSMRDDRYN
ncbi:MAG: hypothetical protein ABGX16_00635, partial [Pirellulales bacterium]